ncbi:MAG: succinyl-diaminopimelate desuccinylase [Pseudoclavibacter sp.]
MNTSPDALDLSGSVIDLTRAICDIPSESGDERRLADAVEHALRTQTDLEVLRDGDTVVARTHLGRDRRVLLAGHLDTVPIRDNVPTTTTTDAEGTWLNGRGTVDMKAGDAVFLAVAGRVPAPSVDITYVFYDNEEVAADLNGLGRVSRKHPEWLAADFAILGEPTGGEIEGGCNGTCRFLLHTRGRRAHSARAWVGVNAIHAAAGILDILRDFEPETITVDGLAYREGLNAVGITGGVAGNVIPDECTVHVNYRFAPSRSAAEAEQRMRDLFAGYEIEFIDMSPGARPGLDAPIAKEFVEAVGSEPKPKYGWTDVSRFSALGIPAVNFGPGDALLAHADDERLRVDEVPRCLDALVAWLR